MRTCTHACMRANVHTCMNAHMHTCMRACVHECLHACMAACAHTLIVCLTSAIYSYTCVHADIHTYMHTYRHTVTHHCTRLGVVGVFQHRVQVRRLQRRRRKRMLKRSHRSLRARGPPCFSRRARSMRQLVGCGGQCLTRIGNLFLKQILLNA